MAISRAKKTEKVQLLAAELETSTTAIIGTFSKLTVAKDFQLRKVIREAGGKYRVVKNKLAAISGTGTQVEAALKGLKGVNSVAFTAGDPVALARVFAKWAGENAAEFHFKLGIVEGKNIKLMMSLDDIEDVQGYVAAEANHTSNKILQKQLDKIFEKFQVFLDRYDDQEDIER